MAQLIAFSKVQSNSLVGEILQCWDAGNAVAILSPDLPKTYANDLITLIDPDRLVGENNTELKCRRRHELVDDAALVIATSGTSGAPKAVVHTHASLRASANATAKFLGINHGEGLWINALPLMHIGGFSTITKSLYQNMSLEILPRFDYETIQRMASDNPTYMPIVRANLSKVNPKLFRALVLGGGVAPSQVPHNAFVTYGLTETGSGCVYNGRALDGVRLMISENSEILIAGDMLAPSYRDNRPLTGSGGYFHTGDLGEIDSDVLTVFGRASDVIRSGGETITPGTVEAILSAIPGVTESAVIGVRDEQFGQIAWAVLVLESTTKTITLEEIKELVREHLPHYFAPRGLTILTKLPKTPLGKVVKKDLILLVEQSSLSSD